MKNQYKTLVNILDRIIFEVPNGKYKKRYSTDNKEQHDQSRAKAFIHLFLMAKHGLLDFTEREKYVTDGSYDGGIDGYYIDHSVKMIYLIQSKFRTTAENFAEKKIAVDELLCMDISRILKGEENDINGNKYNGKILGLQRELQELKNPAKYEHKVIILANSSFNSSQLNRLTGGFEAEVINFSKTYKELVFPVVSGNYFCESELSVDINLANSEHPRIKYKVNLGNEQANITVLFAPTVEIAKILHKYKNSILKFNPRSYLDMKKNSVNSEILKTLTEKENNEFAVFNNGITFISSDCNFTENTGKKNTASLSLSQPQIINGGQTAFTLSKAYEENCDDTEKLKKIFKGKEVLVKIISFSGEEHDEFDDEVDESGPDIYSSNQLAIIENVSQATNRQSPINEADRKANDESQIKFQQMAFEKIGMYYERKRGEFGDGLTRKFIKRDELIKRDDLVRCILACNALPGEARKSSQKYLFSDKVIDKYLGNMRLHNNYLKAYLAFNMLKNLEKEFRDQNDKYSVKKHGSAFRYGKFAVISALFAKYGKKLNFENIRDCLMSVLNEWLNFEGEVKKMSTNTSYFVNDKNMLNYYKSINVNSDIREYFS